MTHQNVSTKDPAAVAKEVQAIYLAMFPKGDRSFVPRAFGWIGRCFTGRHADYQAVDAHYHDFEHTLQGTLCMMDLLRGRHHTGVKPLLTQRMFELGLLAILMHDTGYLKRRDDTEGTGAKYTATHVERSAEFAAQLLKKKGYNARDIRAVQNMIRCTGVDISASSIPFQSELERIVGFALGTGDLLGQMAAQDYVEKLPVLYNEFAEAAHYTTDKSLFIALFTSAEDLMKKTPIFWEKYVLTKLDRDFGGQHHYLDAPFPGGRNHYIEKIEHNVRRLRDVISTDASTTTFLKEYYKA